MGKDYYPPRHLAGATDDQRAASGNVVKCFSVWHWAVPDVPARMCLSVVLSSDAVQIAVVPLHAIGVEHRLRQISGDLTSPARALERAAKDQIELLAVKSLCCCASLSFSLFIQGQIGSPGMLPGAAPCGLAVTNQPDFFSHEPPLSPIALVPGGDPFQAFVGYYAPAANRQRSCGILARAMAYLLALDQGTTSSRAIVFRDDSSIVSVAQREFTQIYPQPGWVEHDPREIWSTQVSVAVEAISSAGLAPRDISAVGITNQRETTIIWDRRTGEPIYNAIVWQDRRTADFCADLKATGAESEVQRRTGLLLDPYFSGTKVRWILDHVAGARERAERGELAFGTVDTWLIWHLTEGRVHATDVSNASRTLLLNLETADWDDEMLRLLGVPRALLPEVKSSSGLFGESSTPLAGWPFPIAGVAGDQQAALFGQACFDPGMGKNTYGTGCFLLQNTGTTPTVSKNRLLTTIAWKTSGAVEYALEGSVFIGGAVVQWLRDGLKLIRTAADSEALAASVPDAGGVFLVPAFAGLGAPYWDPYARGAMLGITRGTTEAHVARAALESIALQSADLLEAMKLDAQQELKELRVDGGACRNNLLMQMQADFLQAPVVRAAVTETTALGAAYLAGLATGVYKNIGEISSQWRADRRFEPQMPAEQAAATRARWKRAVERSRGWAQE